MTDKTIDKVIDAGMPMLEQYMGIAGDYLSTAIDKVGEPAYDLAMMMLRIDAASNILAGLLALLCYRWLTIGFDKIFKQDIRQAIKSQRIHNHGSDLLVIRQVARGFAGVVCGIVFLVNVGDIWNWIGIFYPEVYGAHEMFVAATSTTQ